MTNLFLESITERNFPFITDTSYVGLQQFHNLPKFILKLHLASRNFTKKLFKSITVLCRWWRGDLFSNYFFLTRSSKKPDIQLESNNLSGAGYIYPGVDIFNNQVQIY